MAEEPCWKLAEPANQNPFFYVCNRASLQAVPPQVYEEEGEGILLEILRGGKWGKGSLFSRNRNLELRGVAGRPWEEREELPLNKCGHG